MLTFSLICAIAKQCLMTVAVAGIGKSTCTMSLQALFGKNCKVFDSITRSGLRYIAEEITNFGGLVIIDDLGKSDTIYSRMSTITTLAELAYSHFIRKLTYTVNIEVNNFTGACSMNIQPVLMNSVVDKAEWEAVIRDKTIRYYHLNRPRMPIRSLPELGDAIVGAISDVSLEETDCEEYWALIRIGLYQWSYARTLEHVSDMLKACALIDKRNYVNKEDMIILKALMVPMMLERLFFKKYELEGATSFDKSAMAILTELSSFPVLTVEQICVDYKIGEHRAREIIAKLPEWCYVDDTNKNVVVPTAFTMAILEDLKRAKKVMEEE